MYDGDEHKVGVAIGPVSKEIEANNSWLNYYRLSYV